VSGPLRGARGRRRTAGAALVAILAAALLLVRDRGSLQRGNRLFRAGDAAAAADVYGRSARPGEDEARYNLGTALLAVDIDSAEAELRSASESADLGTAQKAFYNLGYRLLIVADLDPDSTAAVLSRAVATNRQALRMDPSDQDARWNLALAQRRLDELRSPRDEAGTENSGESDDEMETNEASLARSDKPPEQQADVPEDPRPADSPGERRGPQEGARETWATQDPGPMTRAEALELLAGVRDDPEALVRGIMWSRRPDVAWWSGQLSPGGRW